MLQRQNPHRQECLCRSNSTGDASCVAKKGLFTENKGLNTNLATPIRVASP
jgi:hypothetical protein